MTKVVGGVCGALLIYLMGKWAAETVYHVGAEGHGEEHAAAYVIETDSGEPAEPEPEVDFAELMASADAGAGARVFNKCKACHKLDGTDGVGPHLNGVVNRDIASVAGFNYSGALAPIGDVWDYDHLSAFLTNPQAAAPGTAMGFNGLSSAEDRANVIAYIESES
ncbi:cytochrome c [Sagittula marina]|uniref:Cytochrome c n=2 Tax=Roseobacteraceae TaxID=2854170 RepID=A0A7W6DN37_9RHOB|nr:cytochrome c [Sagittula marina]